MRGLNTRVIFQHMQCIEKWHHTLQRKSHLCNPRKGIARPQSQFPPSYVCDDLYIFPDWSTYFPVAEKADRSWGIFVSNFQYWVFAVKDTEVLFFLIPKIVFLGTKGCCFTPCSEQVSVNLLMALIKAFFPGLPVMEREMKKRKP